MKTLVRCLLKNLAIILSFSTATLLIGLIPADARNYTITKISNNLYNYSPLNINDSGQIVWQGADYIYLFSAGIIKQVSTEYEWAPHPILNQKGQIVWGYNNAYIYSNGNITKLNIAGCPYNNGLQINNRGDVVWQSRTYLEYEEIYLYSAYNTNRVTSNNVYDGPPIINDKGQIVWLQGRGPAYNDLQTQVMLSDNGIIKSITNNDNQKIYPSLNNNGQIVWSETTTDGYQDIYLYDNGNIKRINDNNSRYINYYPKINDNGQVAWVGANGSGMDIYFYSNGNTNRVTNYQFRHVSSEIDINQSGQIVWAGQTYGSSAKYIIYMYDKGIIEQVTDGTYNAGAGSSSANYPKINNSGMIVWGAGSSEPSPGVYLATPENISPYSKYGFVFNYNDGSGDYYTGYIIDRDGLASVGQRIDSTNSASMGGTLRPKLRGPGYYQITSIIDYNGTGGDVGRVYLTSYYDGDTKKFSNTIYADRNGKKAPNELYLGELGLGRERGYVYDPSVPDNDGYFGNYDVTYLFGPTITDGKKLNFLQTYITNLPYWTQPNEFQSSCAEVAGAIVLAHWDQKGYDKLLPEIWEDNTLDSEYINLIAALSGYFGYIPFFGGTISYAVGPGLQLYTTFAGYPIGTFNTNTDEIWAWEDLKSALDKKYPTLLWLSTDDSGHFVVARGFWNDGRIVCNWGWGKDKYTIGNGSLLTNVIVNKDDNLNKNILYYFKNASSGAVRVFTNITIGGAIYFNPN